MAEDQGFLLVMRFSEIQIVQIAKNTAKIQLVHYAKNTTN